VERLWNERNCAPVRSFFNGKEDIDQQQPDRKEKEVLEGISMGRPTEQTWGPVPQDENNEMSDKRSRSVQLCS